MTTRRAYAKEEENKLQQTLIELKKSRDLCDQLLKERDESEREVLDILHCNKKLKSEMAEIHKQYLSVIEERDKLQEIINSFDQCSDEVESMVSRVSCLEHQLNDANNTISLLKTENHDLKKIQTQDLYQNVLSCETCHCSKNNVMSKNKLKKYTKINKIIRKTQILIKKNKKFIKYINNRKSEIENLKMYKIQSENVKVRYEADIKNLQFEINCLNQNLSHITNKYELSKKQIEGHIRAMDELIDLTTNNHDRFNSLTQNHTCSCNSNQQIKNYSSSELKRFKL